MASKYGVGMCIDCHHEQRVVAKEWLKAAQPRCRNCGGRLEESLRPCGTCGGSEEGSVDCPECSTGE
jgi:hypothetical protein